MIKFYFHPSPNPLKIALYLEETGEPYDLIPVDTRKGGLPVTLLMAAACGLLISALHRPRRKNSHDA